MEKKQLGAALIISGILILGGIFYMTSRLRQQSIVFSPKLMLSALWNSYKKEYIEPSSGRTLDRQRNDTTTSEGQSYTMLRAVWQDDKETFDRSWQWTKDNLKRPDSNLSSWLYGKKPDGSYGILEDQGGQNAATDADTDIAMALLFAGNRWGDQQYTENAKNIIKDIWNNEIVTINGIPYLAANNIEKNSASAVIINPSYFAPYAYRMFAQADPEHDWGAVIDSSYRILKQASISPLDKNSSSGLPPDWIALDRKTAALIVPAGSQMTTNYGYDAMRVPFRVALDWEWYKEPRAKELLRQYDFLNQEWQDRKIIFASYSHDGQALFNSETPAMYGTSLGYFLVTEPATAETVYQNKLQSLYSPDLQDWKKPLGYYDDNWAWFGLALYNHDLVNLFTERE